MMSTRMLASRCFSNTTKRHMSIRSNIHKQQCKNTSQCVRMVSSKSEKEKMRAHLLEKWLGKKEVYPLIVLMGGAVALTTTCGIYYLVTSPDVHLHRSSRRTMRVTPAEQEAAAALAAVKSASSTGGVNDPEPMVIDRGVGFTERK